MSAQEELAARAAIRRERLLAQQQSSPLADVARAGAVGAAAGTVAAPDSVAAEEVEEVERPVAASEAASAEPQEAIAFADVPDGYWAEPYIDALSSRGLISGYDDGTFRPDQPVTRAQTANIVSRTFDLTADKASLEFSDVESEYWARESIGEVVRGGFMTGFPDDTFKPNLPVTRAQALTTLVTGLGIESPQNIQATLSRYTDASAIPQWANDKIAAATAGSLVVNYPDASQLNPAEPTTRAELSALIYQALVREGVVEPVESEYVVEP
nr:S-layer homology domain-containing protein [cf. Phormidesmis sp. LEGE 11477]